MTIFLALTCLFFICLDIGLFKMNEKQLKVWQFYGVLFLSSALIAVLLLMLVNIVLTIALSHANYVSLSSTPYTSIEVLTIIMAFIISATQLLTMTGLFIRYVWFHFQKKWLHICLIVFILLFCIVLPYVCIFVSV